MYYTDRKDVTYTSLTHFVWCDVEGPRFECEVSLVLKLRSTQLARDFKAGSDKEDAHFQ